MHIFIKAFMIIGLFLNMTSDTIPNENPCNIMFPRSNDVNWGNGLYLIHNDAEIPVYRDTKGTKFGKIGKVNNYFKFWDKDGKRRSLEYGDIEYIGHYSMSFLKVEGTPNNNYVKIFLNTFEEGLYVKKTDLARQKSQFFGYKELLYSKNIPIEIEEFSNWASIGVNLKSNCLNLRKGPSVNDSIIRCLRSNKETGKEFSHFSILETKNDWAKVEVATYIKTDEAESECDYSEYKKEVGWIKAMDDNGYPNIWYSVMNY